MIHLGLIFFFLSITYTVKPTFPAAFRYYWPIKRNNGKTTSYKLSFLIRYLQPPRIYFWNL